MKKTILGLAIIVGFGIMDSALSASFCLDVLSACNDFKITYAHAEGNAIDAHGYEYGCGATDRQISGTITVDGSNVNVGITGVANGAQVMQRNFLISKTTGRIPITTIAMVTTTKII